MNPVENFVEAIRLTAPGGRIAPGHYRYLVEQMRGPDPDDHILFPSPSSPVLSKLVFFQ